MIKYKWKVQPAPTGRYRSFEKRGWPQAETETGAWIASLDCKTEYQPCKLKTGDHEPIRVLVRIAKGESFSWAYLKGEWATVAEAKAAFASFMESHPDHDFNFKG